MDGTKLLVAVSCRLTGDRDQTAALQLLDVVAIALDIRKYIAKK